MASFGKLLCAAVAVVGTQACGGAAEHVTPSVREVPAARPVAVRAPTVDENLAALRALNVVSVAGLETQVPAEAFFCYGQCPGIESKIAEARAKQPERLAKLVEIAAHATGKAAPAGATEPAAIDANLRALNELHIVVAADLVREEPAVTGHCYGACPEDQAAAQKVTDDRAAKLAEIVAAAKGL